MCCMCLVAQSCLTCCNPMACSPPGFSVHGDSPGESTGMGCHPVLQGNLSNQGIKPRSSALQADFFFFYHLSHQGSLRTSESYVINLGESVQIRGLYKENRTELQG